MNLNLRKNNITNEGFINLNEKFKNLINLIEFVFDISSNELSDKGLEFIIKALNELPLLAKLTLNLSNNKIEENGFNLLGNSFL